MNFLRFVAHFSNGQLVSEEKTLKMAYSSSQFISAAHWIDFDLIVVYCRLLDSFPVVRLLQNWSTSLVAFDASFSISKTFSLVSVWARRVCFSILLCEYWNMNWITELVTGKNVLAIAWYGFEMFILCINVIISFRLQKSDEPPVGIVIHPKILWFPRQITVFMAYILIDVFLCSVYSLSCLLTTWQFTCDALQSCDRLIWIQLR